MNPRFSRTSQLLTPTLLALAVAWAPCASGQQAPMQWKGETQMNGTAYIPLENIRSFYKFTPLPAARGSDVTVVGNSGIHLAFKRHSCESQIGGYRCRLAYPVEETAGGELLISKTDAVKLIDPILRPTYISPRSVVRSVVIDPGHGGHDVGITSNQVREADITLLLARKLKEILIKRGLPVVLTREQNHAVSERQRVDTISRAESPIFISLHLNSGRSDTKGIETYTLRPLEQAGTPLPGNATDEANAALAFCLQSAMVAATSAADGGCKRARFSLLSSATCPAAMVLLGYATHTEEAEALNSDEYRDKIAIALADGITTFAKALNPDATVAVSAAPIDTTPPTPYKADAPAPPKNQETKRTTPSRSNAKSTRNTKPKRK